MSTDLDGFLAAAEEILGQMKEAVPRLGRHVTFMPSGPVGDRAAVVMDLLRQAATDIDAALQRWDDLDREQEDHDRADDGVWDEPTWDEIYGVDRW